MISYPKIRMVFMLIGIGFTLYTCYGLIGEGFVLLGELAAWVEATF
jgi:hypothetical protein